MSDPYEVDRKIQESFASIVLAQRKHEKLVAQLQDECDHIWAYSRDPSGNNDSSYYCRACGRIQHKRPDGYKP